MFKYSFFNKYAGNIDFKCICMCIKRIVSLK